MLLKMQKEASTQNQITLHSGYSEASSPMAGYASIDLFGLKDYQVARLKHNDGRHAIKFSFAKFYACYWGYKSMEDECESR